jgi:hypothetical protein
MCSSSSFLLTASGGKGASQNIPSPALRNSLYLKRTEFNMNEDFYGKRSAVTNAQ